MDRHPVVTVKHVQLVGRLTEWYGPFVATYITYPQLGVSILASLERLGGAS